MDKSKPSDSLEPNPVQLKDVLAALKRLEERIAVLEEVTQEMRSELDELQNDKDWVGGTD